MGEDDGAGGDGSAVGVRDDGVQVRADGCGGPGEERGEQVVGEAVGPMGGLAKNAPIFAVIFLIVTMATLALPGSPNFIGEFLILNGTFQVSVAIAIVASSGVALAAYYALRMYQRTMHDPLPPGSDSREISLRDGLIVVPMVLVILVLAFAPQIVLGETGDAIATVVEKVGAGG